MEGRIRDRRRYLASARDVDTFVNLKEEDLVSAVQKATNGVSVDVVLDTIGGDLFRPCLRTLRVGGRQIVIANSTGPDANVHLNLTDFYHNQLHLIGSILRSSEDLKLQVS